MDMSRETRTIDVDEMLHEAGDFGRFQYKLLVLFSFINALSAFHYFGQTFISVVPDYTCKLQDNELASSSCSKFVQNDSGTFQQACSQWEYNSSYNYISLVQELNWICDKDWIASIGQSVFFAGSLIGSLAFGILADRIGRLHVLVMANVFAFVGNFITIFSTNAWTYGMARIVAGSASDANFVMMYMLVMEYIRPSMRTLGLNLTIGVFYCLGSMLVPWVAVATTHWKFFLATIAFPHLIVILFYFMVPESAQWLISKGRLDKAMQCFERIAKINKRVIPRAAIDGLQMYAKENIKDNKSHANFMNLLKTPKLRKKTIILIFKSMVLNLCYDAIARNVNGMGFSPFFIFSATSVTIFPGCLVILLLQDRIGRKALASCSMLLGGLFISVVGVILASFDTPDATLTLVLTVIARLNVIIAYNSGSQYAFELIPTEVRAQGVSVIHVAGFGATLFSPQILYLAGIWQPLPEITLGVLLIFGSVICLFLPETLNRTLPVTLADGEEFGEDERIFDFACFKKNITESTNILTGPNSNSNS